MTWRFPALLLSAVLLVPISPLAAAAQSPRTPSLPAGSPFMGGVPDAEPGPAIALSIADAIRRGLDHNLGVLQAQDGVDRARAARWQALSELLPEVNGTLDASRRKSSLEAFGFPLGPTFPRVIGPFSVYDARVAASQSLFDLSAINGVRAASLEASAARHQYKSARDVVVLVSANLYLQTLAAAARVDTARAQLDTAQALHTQAIDLRASGIVAGLDVVRAEVRLLGDRQRATAAENDYQKVKLQLARVIGLPLGQEFTLVDQLPTVPVPEMTLEEALERAHRERPDYLAALDRVKAAELSKRAAAAERLPTVRLNADYGAIGLTPGSALPTFSVSGLVDVPIFKPETTSHTIAADTELRGRRQEADDLRAEIDYDVRTAFLDLRSTGEELRAAERGRELAAQQLTQSRDRFAAGVANNIEVVQAQEAVTQSSEQYIAALYGFNVSKALLARSLGAAETAVEKYLGGSK